MSILLEKMRKDINALREGYEKLSWWQRLFYPHGLGAVLFELKNQEPYDLLHVYQTSFSNTWFFQRWIFSSLRLFSAAPATSILESAYREIGDLDELDNERWNTLNVDYFMIINRGPASDLEYIGESRVAHVLKKIQEADLLTDANLENMTRPESGGGFDAFINGFIALYRDKEYKPASPLPYVPTSAVETTKRIHAPDPLIKKNTQTLITATVKQSTIIAIAIEKLRENDLLQGEHAQAIFDIVTTSKNPCPAASNFEHLKKCGLLESEHTSTIMQLMVTRANSNFASSFRKLQEQDLLKGEFALKCINAMVNLREDLECDQDQYHFALSLAILQEINLLQGSKAQFNFDAVMNHEQPTSISITLSYLHHYKLLTQTHAQANFDAIINHKDPKGVVYAFEVLARIDLLRGDYAQANFDALIANNIEPSGIAWTLETLYKVGLLTGTQTQTNVHNIVTYYDVLINHEYEGLWDRIPPHKMTQEYLDELITICQQSELSLEVRQNKIVSSWLKTSPEVFARAASGGYKDYSCHLALFIESTLKDLHQRDEKRPPNTTFDLSDDEECKLCFYIIRNLIHNNSKEVLGEIRFLLSIPAVRTLAVTGGTLGKNTNELLKLAVSLNNKEAVSILLEIPEVSELAKQDKSYPKGGTAKSKSPEASGATPGKIGLFGQDSQEKADADDDLSATNTYSI